MNSLLFFIFECENSASPKKFIRLPYDFWQHCLKQFSATCRRKKVSFCNNVIKLIANFPISNLCNLEIPTESCFKLKNAHLLVLSFNTFIWGLAGDLHYRPWKLFPKTCSIFFFIANLHKLKKKKKRLVYMYLWLSSHLRSMIINPNCLLKTNKCDTTQNTQFLRKHFIYLS